MSNDTTQTSLQKFRADVQATKAHNLLIEFFGASGRKFVGFDVEEADEDCEDENEIFASVKYSYRTPYGQPAAVTSDSVRVVKLHKEPKVKGVKTPLKDRAKLRSYKYVEGASEEALSYVLEEVGRKFGGVPFAPQHTTEGGVKGVKPDHVERVVRKEAVRFVDSNGNVQFEEEEVEEFVTTKAIDDDNRPGDKPVVLDDSSDD
jgi:hypothetical protein